MRHLRFLRSLCVLVPSLLVACGHDDVRPHDADGGGNDDGGNVGDTQSRPALRPALGLDLTNVGSFAFVSQSAQRSAINIRKALDGGVDDGGTSGGDGGLYALTLTGETLSVTLVEETNPQARVPLLEPSIDEIHATPTWVLFRTAGYTVNRAASDGGVASIPCNTIAARRSDGALFCTEFVGRPTTHGIDFSLQSNAAGDVVYLEGGNPADGTSRVHRLSLGGADGPIAIGLTPPIAEPRWFISNSDGDLLHICVPSPLEPSTRALTIFPGDGSTPIQFGTTLAGLAVRGAIGDADENTFYVLVGGDNGVGFMGTIRVLTKQGAGFVETEVTPNLPMVTSFGMPLRLADGIYLFSPIDHALARVFVGGVLVADPVPVPITGVDSILRVNSTLGGVVFLANTPSGVQFIRHDGTTQENVPVPADITLTRVVFAPSGAIDFIGVRGSTLETIRGSVEPGSLTAEIATTGVLDPARIVTFTRID